MHSLAAIDLNLIVALHALLEEHSVTAAARRVGLSQPAMSHALARLRDHLGDPLLIRSGRSMVPTARAAALLPAVRRAVAELEQLLGASDVAPGALQISLRLVADDAVGTTWLPELVRELASVAPGVELDVLPRGAPGRKALVRRGEADLAVGDFSGAGLDLCRAPLYDDRWVCVVRSDHPLARAPSARAFAALPHLIVSPTGGRRGLVDVALERIGLERRVPLAVPHFATALAVVQATDHVLTTHGRLIEAHPLQLRAFSPPVALPPIVVSMLWHPRTDPDPVHRWFRGVVSRVAARS